MSNIKNVYNQIAYTFDKTRFSVWKGVREFLDELPSGSLVGDIGCGNGKNMLYRKDVFFKGYDISSEFVKICKMKGLNAKVDNILKLDIPSNSFDYTISIAVIHHLETRQERIKAISELIRVTRKGGKILLYVWAFEQPNNSKRIFKVGDNMVPFHSDGKVLQRFYHIYFQGELESEIKSVKNQDFIIEKSFNELGNWCVIIHKL